MLEDDGKFYPPKPAASDIPPILDYRSPQPHIHRHRGSGARGGSVAKGFGSVFGACAFAGLAGIGSHGAGFLPALALGAFLCVVFAIVDLSTKKHAGFFVGVLLGALTVLGVAILTIGIICGAFK